MRDRAHLKSGRPIGRAWEAHIPGGSSTEEQRSRRPVFDETLRAEVFLALRFVAPRSQILEDRRFLVASRTKPKIPSAAVSIVFYRAAGLQLEVESALFELFVFVGFEAE